MLLFVNKLFVSIGDIRFYSLFSAQIAHKSFGGKLVISSEKCFAGNISSYNS